METLVPLGGLVGVSGGGSGVRSVTLEEILEYGYPRMYDLIRRGVHPGLGILNPYIFAADGIDPVTYWLLLDTGSTPVGLGRTNLSASDFTLSYVRPLTARVLVSANDHSAVTDAHNAGYLIKIHDTDCPGLYRIDWPDAITESGENYCVLYVKATTTYPAAAKVLIDPMPANIRGTVDDATFTPTPTQFECLGLDATKPANFYRRKWIKVATGNMAGHATDITASATQNSKVLLTVTAMPSALADGDEFEQIP